MSDAAAVTVGLPAIGPVCDALLDASDRFASMLRQVRDATVPAIGVWDIGETAAHASGSHAYFLAIARGDSVEVEDFDHIAESNARALAADPERDPQVLADRLARGERDFVSYVRTVQGDPLVEPFVGMKVPLSTVVAIELSEILVHGFDIARAAGLPWRINPKQAALTLDGFLPLLPFVVDERMAARVRGRCELRVRHGSRAVLVIDRGTLRVEAPSTRSVDCRVSVDPVAFLLLSYRRMALWQAVLRGSLLAWGWRPWLAAGIRSVLKSA